MYSYTPISYSAPCGFGTPHSSKGLCSLLKSPVLMAGLLGNRAIVWTKPPLRARAAILQSVVLSVIAAELNGG